MSERESKSRSSRSTSDDVDEVADVEAPVADTEHKAELDDGVDAILDEIDEVLEVNAAEFVQGFVQKGGE